MICVLFASQLINTVNLILGKLMAYRKAVHVIMQDENMRREWKKSKGVFYIVIIHLLHISLLTIYIFFMRGSIRLAC